MTYSRHGAWTGHRQLRLPVAVLAVVVAATVTLTGCGAAEPTRTTSAAQGTGRLTEGLPVTSSGSPSAPPSAVEDPYGGEGPDASDSPDPALAGQPTPTLPPGDPGTDGAEDATPEPPAGPVAAVPAEALLDTATVGAVAGGSWTAGDAAGAWCAAPRTPGARVSRAQALATDGGALVESVSAHGSRAAARRAVERASARLSSCGWTVDRDPRLGEASEQLIREGADGPEVALVLAADGVGVVLVASGTAAAQGTWESLADLALGSSCLAAEEGCH